MTNNMQEKILIKKGYCIHLPCCLIILLKMYTYLHISTYNFSVQRSRDSAINMVMFFTQKQKVRV